MRLYRSLIKENPMMAEIGRFRKRYFAFQSSSSQINGGAGLVLFAYGLFTVFCIYFRGDFAPIPLLPIYLTFAIFAIPLMLHGAIAGERERRSWEMLLVAPITHEQIIVGKFIAAFLGVLISFGLFMIPVMITAIYHPKTQWLALLGAVVTVLLQLAVIISLTLLISARSRRPLTALSVTMGIVFFHFILLPTFLSTVSQVGSMVVTAVFHPYVQLIVFTQLGSESFMTDSLGLDPWFVFTFHIMVQLLFIFSLLAWSVKTLAFADNEVKFMPKGKNARS